MTPTCSKVSYFRLYNNIPNILINEALFVRHKGIDEGVKVKHYDFMVNLKLHDFMVMLFFSIY